MKETQRELPESHLGLPGRQTGDHAGDPIDTTILRPGETLVRVDDRPAFPAVLGAPTSAGQVPHFRREVAEWVVVELNTLHRVDPGCQRAEWDGATLVLVDPEHEGYPERIAPDAQGRYQIAAWWTWDADLSTGSDVATLGPDSVAALRVLASPHARGPHRLDALDALVTHAAGGALATETTLTAAWDVAAWMDEQRIEIDLASRRQVTCHRCGSKFYILPHAPEEHCAPRTAAPATTAPLSRAAITGVTR